MNRNLTFAIAVSACWIAWGVACGKDSQPAPQTSATPSAATQLLGSWRWNNSCARPDFVFHTASIDFKFDADGARTEHHFASVNYEATADGTIIAHLGEPHGLSGARSPTDLEVKVSGPTEAVILRSGQGKKHVTDIKLTRCDAPRAASSVGSPNTR
jgi:hypothetical protein